MTLLVKDANTTVQSLATAVDGNGNLVPVHAPAATNAQGVSTAVGPQNPLPVINAASRARWKFGDTILISPLAPPLQRP